jgi:molybdenum cofactor cytidylyltransferase
MSGPSLAVALLAAGRSTRFGAADKLMANLGGRPLISWAAETGRAIPAANHFLIAPTGASFLKVAPGYSLRINPDPQQGLSSSLKIAAKAAQEVSATALLILLADMPFVTTAHLHRLTGHFSASPTRAAFTRSPSGIVQPPAIFPATLFPILMQMEGDRGARALAQDATLLDADAQELFDIDREEDLAEARRSIADEPRRS